MATTSEAMATDVEKLRGSNTTNLDQNNSLPSSENEKGAQSSPSHPSDATLAPPNEEPKRSKGKIVILMGALCMATFLAAIDTTIVTTALPTISERFRTSQADYTWVGSAYLLAAAASTPTWGKISDIFGRKPILLLANVVFFFGSLISALSININMLLAGRVIQGTGGGGLLILVNICISDLFSMRSRGIYFGVIGMVWAVASALGPVIGGLFTQYVSWRWCFYINLPLDGLAFGVLFRFLDIETPKTPILAGFKAIDWSGSLLIVGGTVMFLIGLEFGGVSHPWNSAVVICLIIFGLITIGLFFVNEGKVANYPLMPLRLFKRRSNVAALATCFIHGFTFIAGAYYLPLYFQAVLGASPVLSGVYVLPYVLSLSFASAITGIFIKKTGQYLPAIWFGMTFLTLGFGLFIDLPDGRDWARIIIFQIIAGVGAGPLFQSPLIALQSLVEPRDIATATATFGFCRNLGTSMSVVIGGVIFQNGMAKREPMLAMSLPPATAQALGGGSAGASTRLVAQLPAVQRAVATLAYTQSLQTMWIFYASFAAVGLCVSLAIGKNKLAKTHQVQKLGLEHQEKGRKEQKEDKRRSMRKSLEAGGAMEPKEEV